MDFQGKEDGDLTDADKRNRELHEAYQEWETKVADGRETTDSLNERFAAWYYVISSESFDKIHLKRADLVKAKES